MRLSSLGFRLFLLSLISILLALIATTIALNARFFDYFEDRIYGELQQHLEQLTTNLSLDANGDIAIAPLFDRRFEQPFGGLYWQVHENDNLSRSSRSLWGGDFGLPADMSPGVQFRVRSRSPIGTGLLVAGWPILLGEAGDQRQLILSVAIDDTEVSVAALGFRNFLIVWLAIMFTGLLVAAWAQVRIGLAPLKVLRGRIEDIRNGAGTRLIGPFPSEVAPLVDEVNELLDIHERTVKTARARASDLAHGLKTPLTIMRVLAQDLKSEGHAEISTEIETQIASMHHFVERELARVKSDTPGDVGVRIGPVVARMVASIKKLPGGANLNWTVDIPGELSSPFDNHDLSELVGNLLDNARKWANDAVSIKAGSRTDGEVWIRISDDGPGIPDDERDVVLKRGTRLDASVSGTGLGLAIATDLATHAGGKLELSRADIGGLAVEVSWRPA